MMPGQPEDTGEPPSASPGRPGIEVVLSCEADGCRERLIIPWPRGEYTSLIDPAIYGGREGVLTLDGWGPVPSEASGWRVADVGREYRVRCPAHAAELPS